MSNRNVSLVRAKPWRLVTATAAAQKAILRSGVEAVRQVAVDVTGSGLTPWEITAKLDALPPLTPEPQIGSGHPCPPSSAPKKSLPASDCLPKGCPAGTLDRLLARRVEREHIRHWISLFLRSRLSITKQQSMFLVSFCARGLRVCLRLICGLLCRLNALSLLFSREL